MYSDTNAQFRDPQYQENHVKAWKQSGLSQAEYCRQNELPLHRFYNWKAKFESQKLVPVEVQKEPSAQYISIKAEKMRIELPNGIELQIPSNLSLESLIPGLTALRQAL